MNRRLFAQSMIATLASVGLPNLALSKESDPSADEILRLVRMSYAMQDYKLSGNLRDDESGRTQPFELTMAAQVIRFRFSDPAEIVNVDLSSEPPTLTQIKSGSKSKMPPSALSEPLRGMSMSYEDLSLGFLDWPNPKLVGHDTIKLGAKCWVIQVNNPAPTGAYGTVKIWVHQASGGMAKMEAYDRTSGKLVKEFLVRGVQKAGDVTVLEEMRIKTFDAISGEKQALTIMTMDKPEKKQSL
ncbi:MAG: outer membrane lipoprotein-sorting protein [Verrucomicrobiales bacterium]|nr:outer membrane lipoprotein-sorting protein [Verrucomicrobiales bacterium]MCP5560305.1 outer membrane lipoprotein-sorting protein [Verrucomicrobiaceae bacterium]